MIVFALSNGRPALAQVVISTVQAPFVGSGLAVITWRTDVPATGAVYYGTTTAYGTVGGLNLSTTTSHGAALTGLTVNTTYHYEVWGSTIVGGVAVSSGDFVFVTRINPPPTITAYAPTPLMQQTTVGFTMNFSATATDPDGDTMYCSWAVDNQAMQGGLYAGATNFTFTPASSGLHRIVFSVSDIEFTSSAAWSVTANDAPSACGDGIWNAGETVSNCPQDTPAQYGYAPPATINVLNTAPYTIGMFLFPSWHGDPPFLKNWWSSVTTATVTHAGQEQPKKPILGYYDDSNPVAVDWMIQWSLEHGISLFVYDWYDSYFNETPIYVFLDEFGAKYQAYQSRAKFALMWATSVMSNTATQQDFLNGLNHAEQRFFRHPMYLRINNMPVFILWNLYQLQQMFGDNGANDLLKDMKAAMVQRGYPGLYIIAVYNDGFSLPDIGTPWALDGVTSYNLSGKMNMPTDTYDNYVSTYVQTWFTDYGAARGIINAAGNPISYYPPASPGWDNFPWQGRYTDPMYISAVTYSTPAKFQSMLTLAKNFVDSHQGLNPLNMIMIEAWDEWGEGSVLAPRVDSWGFGYLDAVSSVFGMAAATSTPKADLSSITAYPNPFRPGLGHAVMTFAQAPANARIRVYTLSGQLVKDLTADSTGTALWDATNQSGRKIASGVYYVLVVEAERSRTLKVVVQR